MDETRLSMPEMTSTSTPASSWARRTNSSRFSASRTALVATARTGAPEMAATWRMRSSAAMPLAIASAQLFHVSGPDRAGRPPFPFDDVEAATVEQTRDDEVHEFVPRRSRRAWDRLRQRSHGANPPRNPVRNDEPVQSWCRLAAPRGDELGDGSSRSRRQRHRGHPRR